MNLEERCEMYESSLKEEKRVFDYQLKRTVKPYQLTLAYSSAKTKIDIYSTALSRSYTTGIITLTEFETLHAILVAYNEYFINEYKRKESEME